MPKTATRAFSAPPLAEPIGKRRLKLEIEEGIECAALQVGRDEWELAAETLRLVSSMARGLVSMPVKVRTLKALPEHDLRNSQSLERGLKIMTILTKADGPLGIADIADELGYSRSTTHRYVVTLVMLGQVEQVAQRKYQLVEA